MHPRVITQDELANATRFGEFMPVYKVDAHTVVKTGDCVRLAEAAAMKLVREKTSIPVPEVHNAYIDSASGHVRIVMEFIEGDSLEDMWDQYNANEKDQIIQQLHDMFAQLRNVKGTFIGSVDKSACEDPIFDEDLGAYGPYEDEASFNQGIITALKNTSPSGWTNTVCALIGALGAHDIVLTHGDIAPRNIIVRDGNIVAVLDWELAGFYPEYWDYVKALYRPAWEEGWIKEGAVDRVLKPWLVELAVFLHVHSIGGW
jgi:aminoglycoside phosphotransferase (APT) family kinase protein